MDFADDEAAVSIPAAQGVAEQPAHIINFGGKVVFQFGAQLGLEWRTFRPHGVSPLDPAAQWSRAQQQFRWFHVELFNHLHDQWRRVEEKLLQKTTVELPVVVPPLELGPTIIGNLKKIAEISVDGNGILNEILENDYRATLSTDALEQTFDVG